MKRITHLLAALTRPLSHRRLRLAGLALIAAVAALAVPAVSGPAGPAPAPAAADTVVAPRAAYRALASGEDYDPDNPADPGVLYNLTVAAQPAMGGSVSPSGRSQRTPGESVALSASPRSGFRFVRWSRDGETVSTSARFSYTMPEGHARLTAEFVYDPSNPADPDSVGLRHTLHVSASPTMGGYVNVNAQTVMTEGQTLSLHATPRTGFVFQGWRQEGQPVSTQNPLSVTMGTEDIYLTALFAYDPTAPDNPSTNSWDPATGRLVIDDFTPGYLSSTISNLVGDRSAIRSLTVIGTATEGDLRQSGLSGCSAIDFSRVTGVTTLGSHTFTESYCPALATLKLPTTLTLIRSNAFNACPNLTQLTVPTAGPPALEANALAGLPEGLIIYVDGYSEGWTQPDEAWTAFALYTMQGDEDYAPTLEFTQGVELLTPEVWSQPGATLQFNVQAKYLSPYDMPGTVWFSVDNGTWTQFTDELQPGETFDHVLTVRFTEGVPTHTLRFHAVDREDIYSGNWSVSYADVSSLRAEGIADRPFTGAAVTQPDLALYDPTTDEQLVEGTHYTLGYTDNTDAGTASLTVTGLYPYYGTVRHTFAVLPLRLEGDIELADPDAHYTYTGARVTPAVAFRSAAYPDLVEGRDYRVGYRDNVFPGQAVVVVEGIGNYTGTVELPFTIAKKGVELADLTLTLPAAAVTYDGEPHAATVEPREGLGACTVSYTDAAGHTTTAAPVEPGTYTVSLDFAEGAYFTATHIADAGSFTIRSVATSEWDILRAFYAALGDGEGWTVKWDMTGDAGSVASLYGVTTSGGHVTGVALPANGLSGDLPGVLFTLPYLERVDLSGNALSGSLHELVGSALATAGTDRSTAVSVDLSDNALTGNAGAFARLLPDLTTLDLSQNRLTDVAPAIAPGVTALDLSGQTMAATVALDWTPGSVPVVPDALPTLLLYDHEAQGYTAPLSFRLADDDAEPVWEVEAQADASGITLRLLSADNAYRGQSGDRLAATALTGAGKGSRFDVSLRFAAGDADFSRTVDVVDLQALINYAFGSYRTAPFNYTAANHIADDVINVQDVVRQVDLLLQPSADATAQTRRRPAGRAAAPDGAQARLYVEDGWLKLQSPVAVGAIDLTLSGLGEADLTWQSATAGFARALAATDDGLHAIVYSLEGDSLPAGESVLARVPAACRATAVTLASPQARRIEAIAAQGGTATGLDAATSGLGVRTDGRNLLVIADVTLSDVSWTLHAADGRRVAGGYLPALRPGTTRVDLPAHLPRGTYAVTLKAGAELLRQVKIILNQ